VNSQFNLQIAQEHIADLHRAAVAAPRTAELAVHVPKTTPVIALRLAGPDEADELADLAGLDSQRPLTGAILVAVVDGRLVAAISLSDGRVLADPLVPTSEARALLQARAAQLARLPRLRWRPRFRPRYA
jgi:hypothetical protein